MITGLDKHFKGHYSLAWPSGTVPRSLTATKTSILGEDWTSTNASDNTVGNTSGNTHDSFTINGLYVTNRTDLSHMVTLSFSAGSYLANNAVIPPRTTVYIITADNPIQWFGGTLSATLTSRSGTTVSGSNDLALHVVYSAIIKT